LFKRCGFRDGDILAGLRVRKLVSEDQPVEIVCGRASNITSCSKIARDLISRSMLIGHYNNVIIEKIVEEVLVLEGELTFTETEPSKELDTSFYMNKIAEANSKLNDLEIELDQHTKTIIKSNILPLYKDLTKITVRHEELEVCLPDTSSDVTSMSHTYTIFSEMTNRLKLASPQVDPKCLGLQVACVINEMKDRGYKLDERNHLYFWLIGKARKKYMVYSLERLKMIKQCFSPTIKKIRSNSKEYDLLAKLNRTQDEISLLESEFEKTKNEILSNEKQIPELMKQKDSLAQQVSSTDQQKKQLDQDVLEKTVLLTNLRADLLLMNARYIELKSTLKSLRKKSNKLSHSIGDLRAQTIAISEAKSITFEDVKHIQSEVALIEQSIMDMNKKIQDLMNPDLVKKEQHRNEELVRLTNEKKNALRQLKKRLDGANPE